MSRDAGASENNISDCVPAALQPVTALSDNDNFGEFFDVEPEKAHALEPVDAIPSDIPGMCLPKNMTALGSRDKDDHGAAETLSETSRNMDFTNSVTGNDCSSRGSKPLKSASPGARRRANKERDRGTPVSAPPKRRARRSSKRCAGHTQFSRKALTSFEDGLGARHEDATRGILSHSAFRDLTNTTYLRKVSLSREDAIRLFPEFKSSVDYVFDTDTSRHAPSGNFKVETSVDIQDARGERWTVVLECLRGAGQRHIRLNRGWAEMCRANDLSVGGRFRLDRWVQSSSPSPKSQDAVVTLSIV